MSGGDEETNLCFKYATTTSGDNFIHTCASKRCFLTGNTSTTTNPDAWQACCAWDQHLYLFPDSDLHAANSQQAVVITIPTVMVTMEQGQAMLDQWKATADNNDNDAPVLYGSISSRWKLNFNLSALLIWILGVTVCAMASHHSASDYRLAIARRTDRAGGRRNRRQQNRRPSGDDDEDGGSQLNAPRPIPRSALHDEQLELEPIHAIGFIIMASSSLIVLFYFEVTTRCCRGLMGVICRFPRPSPPPCLTLSPFLSHPFFSLTVRALDLRCRQGLLCLWMYQRGRSNHIGTQGRTYLSYSSSPQEIDLSSPRRGTDYS